MKLAYFVSHPIQYQAPLLRRISLEPDIDLKVFYFSDFSVKGYSDKGFGGINVKWDIPLLEGYAYEFLPGFRKNRPSGFASPLSAGICRRLRREKFDAVWVHGYHTLNSMQAIAAARLLKIPVLVRSDSTLDDRVRSPMKLALKQLFFAILRPNVRAVLTVGKKNAEYWKKYMGDNIPTFLMPFGVDNTYFTSRAEEAAPLREHLRQALDLQPGLPVFLFASKLQKRKRCIDLVDAFLRLRRGSIEPSAYLLIAGDGDERESIELRIRESGVANIRMLGFKNQSELPALFNLCDVFVLPSIYEPWGLIVNEVMSAARAIVVSDQVGCAPDLLRNGVNGFVFPAQNVDALSSVLQRFLDDPDLASDMGKKAAETIAGYSFEQDVAGLRRALAFAVPGFRA